MAALMQAQPWKWGISEGQITHPLNLGLWVNWHFWTPAIYKCFVDMLLPIIALRSQAVWYWNLLACHLKLNPIMEEWRDRNRSFIRLIFIPFVFFQNFMGAMLRCIGQRLNLRLLVAPSNRRLSNRGFLISMLSNCSTFSRRWIPLCGNNVRHIIYTVCKRYFCIVNLLDNRRSLIEW